MTSPGGYPPAGEENPEAGSLPRDSFNLEVTSLTPGRPVSTTRRRPWLRAAQVVSVFVVVLGVLYALVLPHPPLSALLPSPPPPLPTPFRYTGQPLTCPAGAAWSPDSQRFAVLDYVSCDAAATFNSTHGVLAIYATGTDGVPTPLNVTVLDTLVIQYGLPASVRADATEMAGLRLSYTSIGWSPDGRAVAITYSGGSVSTSDGGHIPVMRVDPRVNGLLLVPVGGAGGQVRVFDQPPAQLSPDVNANGPYLVVAWNLATGQQEVLPIREALAYRWTADDSLVATVPLARPPVLPPPVTAGPVGNPDGGASFALWQTGDISIGNRSCTAASGSSTSTTSGAGSDLTYISLDLATNGPVWSPDGQVYIPQGIYSVGRADAPVPAGARSPGGNCALTGSLADLPLMPVRDAALGGILAKLKEQSQVSLFWRPDGQRVLLTEAPVTIQQGAGAEYAVSIYDCATGKVVATPNTPGSSVQPFGTPTVAWSPDGQRVLLVDFGDSPVAVLGATVLGD